MKNVLIYILATLVLGNCAMEEQTECVFGEFDFHNEFKEVEISRLSDNSCNFHLSYPYGVYVDENYFPALAIDWTLRKSITGSIDIKINNEWTLFLSLDDTMPSVYNSIFGRIQREKIGDEALGSVYSFRIIDFYQNLTQIEYLNSLEDWSDFILLVTQDGELLGTYMYSENVFSKGFSSCNSTVYLPVGDFAYSYIQTLDSTKIVPTAAQ